MDTAGGAFATHNEYRPAWMSANNLEAIVEERSSRMEDDSAPNGPSPKRVRTGFECERCGQSFTEKRSLVRHSKHAANCKRHEQSLKPFKCTICSKGFTRDDVRQRHENEKHHNLKRRQRGLNLISNLRLGSTHQSRPRVIAPGSDSSGSQSEEASSQASATPTSQSGGVYSLQSDDHEQSNGPPPPACSSSIGDTRTGFNSSPGNTSNAYRRRWSSSAESDASLGSSVKITSPSTSFTTYGSDPDQASVVAETCGSGKRGSQDDSIRTARRISFELPSRQDIRKVGASARPGSHKKARICPLCSKSFGTTREEVQAHFDRHPFHPDGEHECTICQIQFIHKADLDHHLASAEQHGSCGLSFVHTRQCSGHHPPGPTDSCLSDHDRARLVYCVQNWEQSQLRDFITVVGEVVDQVLTEQESDDIWSVDGAFRKSMQSLSIRFSGLDIRSTPEYMEQHVRKVYGRLRRSVSSRVPDAQLKIKLGKKSAHDVRLGMALVAAAAEGDTMKMAQLIYQGAPLNDAYSLRDESADCTPLIAAVCSRNQSVVEFLLKQKADPDGIRLYDHLTIATPLCLAAGNGDLDIVQCLLDYGANVNKEAQRNGGHPACYAARNGHTAVLSSLLDQGADVGLLSSINLIEEEDMDPSAPLSSANILAIAVYHDRMSTAKMLVERSEVDADYCDTSAALAMAAYQGNVAMAQLLLGYYPHLCTFHAVWIAASQNHKVAVDTFIDHQRKLQPKSPLRSPRALESAIRRDQQDLASLMMSNREGSPDICDLDLFACRNFESRSAHALFEQAQSTSINKEKLNLAMALACAIYYNDIQAARVLLKTGLQPDAEIYPSNLRCLATNLSLASRLGHADMVQILLQHGADPSADGHLSLDLLEAAIDSGSNDTLQSLFATHAPFELRQDEWSCSSFNRAIQKVCRQSSNNLLHTLILNGVDVCQLQIDDGSNKKTTLLHIVAACEPSESRYETMKLLLEAGVDPRVRVQSRRPSDLIHTYWIGMNEQTEVHQAARRLEDLLSWWERRRDISDHQS